MTVPASLYAMIIVVCSAGADASQDSCELFLAPRPMSLEECQDQRIQRGLLMLTVQSGLAQPEQHLGVRCDRLVTERAM